MNHNTCMQSKKFCLKFLDKFLSFLGKLLGTPNQPRIAQVIRKIDYRISCFVDHIFITFEITMGDIIDEWRAHLLVGFRSNDDPLICHVAIESIQRRMVMLEWVFLRLDKKCYLWKTTKPPKEKDKSRTLIVSFVTQKKRLQEKKRQKNEKWRVLEIKSTLQWLTSGHVVSLGQSKARTKLLIIMWNITVIKSGFQLCLASQTVNAYSLITK